MWGLSWARMPKIGLCASTSWCEPVLSDFLGTLAARTARQITLSSYAAYFRPVIARRRPYIFCLRAVRKPPAVSTSLPLSVRSAIRSARCLHLMVRMLPDLPSRSSCRITSCCVGSSKQRHYRYIPSVYRNLGCRSVDIQFVGCGPAHRGCEGKLFSCRPCKTMASSPATLKTTFNYSCQR